MSAPRSEPADRTPLVTLVVRSAVGGVLMGLANLVPGISGGTMLLAAGIYPRLIQSIAEVTTFRFRSRSLVTLGSVAAAAALAILLLAGPVKDLVVHHRWIMYSLFIGLTLGGVPVVWQLMGAPSRRVWLGAGAGFVGMAALAWIQQQGVGFAGGAQSSFLMLLVAGVAGASAMILPGVSGGYLLLVLGQYVPILSAIAAFKKAIEARDLAAATGPVVSVILPVGLGVAVGIVGVSNLLRLCLERQREITLGVLLGLLLGAVVGLWPFQESRPLEPGDLYRGMLVTEQTVVEIRAAAEAEDLPTHIFRPSALHVAGALGLIAAGFLATSLISRLGKGDE